MSRQYTVQEIATKVRVRGDYESSDFITDAILIDFIDSAYTEVYDLLVTKWEDYYVTELEFYTTAGQKYVAVPADFYKLLGVDINNGGTWSRLYRYNLHERNSNQSGNLYKYRLQDANINFIPTPTSAVQMRMLYIPCADKLTALTDSIDGINGWEELVVLYALRRCQVREETSVTAVDNEISRQLKRLDTAADARDAGEPESLGDFMGGDWYGVDVY